MFRLVWLRLISMVCNRLPFIPIGSDWLRLVSIHLDWLWWILIAVNAFTVDFSTPSPWISMDFKMLLWFARAYVGCWRHCRARRPSLSVFYHQERFIPEGHVFSIALDWFVTLMAFVGLKL